MAKDYSAFTIHLVGHAHMDLGYRWRWNETVHRMARDTFRGVLKLMEEDADITFAQSQLALYEAMEQYYPDIFEGIKKRIAEGRWFVVDGWCEYDHTMPCGEAMIRQHLLGWDYARRKLGLEIDTAWAPDAFSGHTNTLPTILRGCGIRYLLFGRGMPEDTPFFWWEGPDGSRVLAYTPVFSYGGPIGEHLIARLESWEKWGTHEVMAFYGRGDHGGGPRTEDLEELERLQAEPGSPRFVHADPRRYFAEILGQRGDLSVHQGELGTPSRAAPDEGGFSGSLSSEGRNKQRNRQIENLLLTTERFATIALFFQRKPAYPRVDFEHAWKIALRHQFHDELPGTSQGLVYADNARDYDRIEENMKAILDQSLAEISARLCTEGEGTPIVVYNPLAWKRSEPVTILLRLNQPAERLVVQDLEGEPMPTQSLDHWQEGHFWYVRLLFLARDVPSLGFKLFRAFPHVSAAHATESVLAINERYEYILESARLRVRVDKGTGQVRSIYDKQAGREILAGPANVLQAIRERPGDSSGWHIALTDDRAELDAPEQMKVVEHGPVRATVRVGYRYRDSYFEQDIQLVAGMPRVSFRFRGDWHERDCCLKVAFPVAIEGGTATFEQPFGAIVRPADGAEASAQRWIDLSQDEHGVSLLNDCRYAFDIEGHIMRMTLLRGIPDLDPQADEGYHDLGYDLYPHGADWRAAAVRQGFEVNYPLLARQPMRRAGRIRTWGVPGEQKPISPVFAFVEIPQENIVLTALKIEHEDWGPTAPFVVRLYETAGKETEATLIFCRSLAFAEETDHLERRLEQQTLSLVGRRVRIAFKPHEIKTLRMAFQVWCFGVPETDELEVVLPEEAAKFENG